MIFVPKEVIAKLNESYELIIKKNYTRALKILNLLESFGYKLPRIYELRYEAFLRLNEKKKCKLQLLKLLEFDEGYLSALGSAFMIDQNICDWDNFENYKKKISTQILKGNCVIQPLALKYIVDDNELNHKISRMHWLNYSGVKSLVNVRKKNDIKNSKTIVGYFTGDFGDHAISYLIKDLLSYHDKSKFYLIAFSSKERNQNEFFKDIFNEFFNLENLCYEQKLKLVLSKNLDLAIDLSGYTNHSNFKLFKNQIAKKKINYLGYPGTMGTKEYDYILADKTIIPKNHFQFYDEKVLYLKPIYQPYSSYKNINKKKVNRNNFKFGAFNKLDKLTPDIFNAWIEIVNKCPNSTLNLLYHSLDAKNNIIAYCKKKNFNIKKIIFIKRSKRDEYLERMADMDLMLDTFPYNGHTTTQDALFNSRTPVVSIRGENFASRVSYSLLKLFSLEDLSVLNISEYVEIAVNLYNSPEKLNEINKKIENNHCKNKIFSMKSFTKSLEDVFLDIQV